MASAEFASPAVSDALVILGAAGLVIPVFTRFRVTPIIGFILIGILVGPYGLGRLVFEHPMLNHITISDPEALEPFAEFGIILLLFTIGLELSFNRLWQMRNLVFGLGAMELLVIGTSLAIALSMMGQYWTGALALGFALAFSSTAIVLPIAGTHSPVGRAALSMLLFEDIMIVPIIFVLGAMAPNAAGEGWEGMLTTLWQGGLVIAAMMILGRFALPRLAAMAGDAIRQRRPFAVLALDLDRFKTINDRFGHPAGDAVLRDVAARIAASVPEAGMTARLGGEEFMIVLPETDEAGACDMAETIRRRIEADGIVLPQLSGGGRVRVTVSVGAAVAHPPTVDMRAETLAELSMERADRALIVAKSLGRNRVMLAQSERAA